MTQRADATEHMDDADERPSGTIVVGFNAQGQLFMSAEITHLTPAMMICLIHATQVIQGQLICELGESVGVTFTQQLPQTPRHDDEPTPEEES